MTIVRFDENKTLSLSTLKKRAKDALQDPTIRKKLGLFPVESKEQLASAYLGLGAFYTHDKVKAHARVDSKWDVWCSEDDQTIHFLCPSTDITQVMKYYLVRTSEGFDLIPDPEIAQREQARPMVVGAKLPSETLEEAHQRVDLKEYAIQDQAAREALDDEDAQYSHDAMLEDREQIHIGTNFGIDFAHPGAAATVAVQHNLAEKTVTIVDHVEPSSAEAEQRVQRIQEDTDNKKRFEARIEKAVTRTTPGRKRSVDGRIQQMLGVRSQMLGKKKLEVTNGGDPNCKRCAAEPVPCKAHGGARKRKAARELQAIFC